MSISQRALPQSQSWSHATRRSALLSDNEPGRELGAIAILRWRRIKRSVNLGYARATHVNVPERKAGPTPCRTTASFFITSRVEEKACFLQLEPVLPDWWPKSPRDELFR